MLRRSFILPSFAVLAAVVACQGGRDPALPAGTAEGADTSVPASTAAVPHFECDACHTHFPLQDADAPTQAVADALRRTLAEYGHQAARVDLAVHGTCAGCRGDAQPYP